MKFFSKLLSASTAIAVATVTFATMSGSASAACYQYSSSGMVTSTTPVFNNICGVPEGIGNESDFVRIRQSNNGNVTDNQNNPNYNGTGISSACNAGDKFDLWNYVHNDASPDYNNNGTGSAVAHNTKITLNAPVNTTNSQFNFSTTVSADNATSVTDNATLNCNGKQVKLSLVANSVQMYSQPYFGWKPLGDGAINTPTPIGSPSQGSGDMWGCWEYRIVVVYQVEVQPVAPAPVYTCDMLTIAADVNRSVKITGFTTTAKNGATFKNAVVNWGDNTANSTAANIVGLTHQYAANGTYTISATAHFDVNGQDVTATGPNCAKQVTFNNNQPPVVPASTTPTQLVNTGPGEVAGLFAAVTGAGALAHRWMLRRRLGSN
jgi:hypothetical protein